MRPTVNIARNLNKRVAAIWLLFLVCLSLGAGAFATVGTEPVYRTTAPETAAEDAPLRFEDVAGTTAPSTATTGQATSGTAVFLANEDCIEGPAPDKTVFGRYYSCEAVPSDLAKVEPSASSPPISCIDPNSKSDSGEICFWRYTESPNELLPAWRWRDHVGLYNNTPGLDGVVNTMFSFLASVLFAVASFAWWILLELTEWVLTDNLVNDAAASMNRGFAMVTDLLNASGIFLLLAGVGLVVLVRLLVRGRLVRVLGMVLAFVLPIAAIQGLAGRASSTAADSEVPTASPAWIAVTGVNMIDGFTSWFTSGFGRLAILSGSLEVQKAAAVDPSCAPYVAALYDQYYAFSSTPVRQVREAAVEAQRTSVAEFAASQGAQNLATTDPMMWQWVYSQVSTGLLEDARSNAVPTEQGAWESMLAGRSTAEKLQDARHYKVATVSQLWQRAFLGSWSAAQFGNQERAARLYCHLLEANADISPHERAQIAEVANRYAYTVHQGVKMKGQGFSNMSTGAFERGESKDEREKRLYAWAACYRDPTLTGPDDKGGWKVDPAWAALSSNEITDEVCHNYFEQQKAVVDTIRNEIASIAEAGVSALGNDNCGGWGVVFDVISGNCIKRAWNKLLGSAPGAVGDWLENNLSTTAVAGAAADAVADEIESQSVDRSGTVKPLEFENENAVYAAIDKAAGIKCEDSNVGACGDYAAANFTSAKDAGNLVLAVKGYNPTQRLALSVLGLFTSIIYVYAIGFLAIGSFLAKKGLIILIMMLPVTLTLIAIPSARNERNQTGMKMLRLTAGFIMSHGLLSFVLGLILSVILLFESLVGGDGGSVVNAAIPLAALFIVKKLLQSVGLGNLTSMQGALGMPLAAATMAAGKDWNTAATSKFNNLTGGQKWDPKTGQYKARGLSAADAFAKRVGKRAAMSVPKAGQWAAKKAGGHLSERLALPERRTQLLGRRDANGNLVELGLAQRMRSLAGLMDMAKDSRVLGNGTRRFLNTTAGKKFDSFAQSNRFARATGNADRAKAQMEWRRASIQAITGGNREERAAARADYASRLAEDIVASQRALRDGDGNIIRDPRTGQAILGYRYSEVLRSRLGESVKDHQGREIFALEDAATGKRDIATDELQTRPDLVPQRREDGSYITGKDGKNIYGWAYDDGAGVTVIDYETYQNLGRDQKRNAQQLYSPNTLKAGVRYVYDAADGASIIDHAAYMQIAESERLEAERSGRLTTVTSLKDGKRYFSDDELVEHARRFTEEYGLRPGQAVFSAVGFDGIVAPALGDADGRNRLIVTKYEESSEDLARSYRVQYLANHQKTRPKGTTDDQWCALLHMMENYLGGYDDQGRKTDVLLDELGISADSAYGREQVQLALSGKASDLDKIHYEIPAEVYQSMVRASLAYSPRGEMASVFQDISAERTARLTQAQMQLEVEQETIAGATVRLETNQVLMRSVTPKLKAARAASASNNNVLVRNVEVRGELEAEIGAAEVEIAELEAEFVQLEKSAAPAARLQIDSMRAKIAARKDARDKQADALASLQDAIDKAAREQQRLVDEEQEYARQIEELARVVADDSVAVFNAAKRAEELGAQLDFAFKAFRRDKGKEDWSKIDDAIDTWIKAHNNKWAADGKDVRALEEAFKSALDSGDEVGTRKAYDELASVLNRLGRAGSRAAGDGAAKHGQILNDLAAMEGNLRHIVETNPSVIPWTGRNFND